MRVKFEGQKGGLKMANTWYAFGSTCTQCSAPIISALRKTAGGIKFQSQPGAGRPATFKQPCQKCQTVNEWPVDATQTFRIDRQDEPAN